MDHDFHRVRRLPPYVFAEVNSMKAAARAAGEDVLDFGMGNPDLPSPSHVVEKLVEVVQNPRTHRYSVSRGIAGLRRANSEYYGRRFNVDIDPETETIVTLGSKEGFANLAMAITSPGDIVLVPNPSYPIHAYGFIIAGGALRHIPVGLNIDLRKDLERAVVHSVPPPLALVLNFPSISSSTTLDINVSIFIASRRCNFFKLIAKLSFFPPYNIAGIDPSNLSLLTCPDEAVVLFVAFNTFIN